MLYLEDKNYITLLLCHRLAKKSVKMSFDGDTSRLSARSRSTRSHSLKPQSQPIIALKQRSKRTMSLPSKPVLLPLINVQRCYDNWEGAESEDDESNKNDEEMGTSRLI